MLSHGTPDTSFEIDQFMATIMQVTGTKLTPEQVDVLFRIFGVDGTIF
jgi:hypothetical protein